jgi:hypothetical protein
MLRKITEFIWQCITNQKYSKFMALNHGRRKTAFVQFFGRGGIAIGNEHVALMC